MLRRQGTPEPSARGGAGKGTAFKVRASARAKTKAKTRAKAKANGGKLPPAASAPADARRAVRLATPEGSPRRSLKPPPRPSRGAPSPKLPPRAKSPTLTLGRAASLQVSGRTRRAPLLTMPYEVPIVPDSVAPARTRLSAATTSGMLAPTVAITDAAFRAALRAVTAEPCTRILQSGSYGTALRACQVLNDARGAPCRECFVFKVAKMDDELAPERRGSGMVRQPPAEALVHREITLRLRAARSHGIHHIAHFIAARNDPRHGAEGNVITFMRDVPLLKLARGATAETLADVGSMPNLRVSDRTWRALWLQLIGTLADIQGVIAGFQHNDLHDTNVMVTRAPAVHACVFTRADGARLSLRNPRLSACIIDWGFAAWDGGAVQPKLPAPVAMLARRCALIDVFRAAARIYEYWMVHGTARAAPRWFEPWVAFLKRWLPGATLDSSAWSHYVPVGLGLAHLQIASKRLTPHGVRPLLSDPYFDVFLAPAAPPIADVPLEEVFAP